MQMLINLRTILITFLYVASVHSSVSVDFDSDLIDIVPEDILIKILVDYFPAWQLKPFRLINKRFRKIVDAAETRIIETAVVRPKFRVLYNSIDKFKRLKIEKDLLRISHDLRNHPEVIEDLGLLAQFILRYPPKIPNLVCHTLELLKKLPDDHFREIERYELIDESVFTLLKYLRKGKRGVLRRCMNLVDNRRQLHLCRDYRDKFYSNFPKRRDPARLGALINESYELNEYLRKRTNNLALFFLMPMLFPLLLLEFVCLHWWRPSQIIILPLIGAILNYEISTLSDLAIYLAQCYDARE